MDTDGGTESYNDQQVDNAIRAIREKKPLPEIDFSIHVMEDGTQVSTLERVCKGRSCPATITTPPSPPSLLPPQALQPCRSIQEELEKLTRMGEPRDL